MNALQEQHMNVTKLTRAERAKQCLAALRYWGGAGTSYRVARTIGVSPSYALRILWGMVDEGLVVANPVQHRANVQKWVFEVAK